MRVDLETSRLRIHEFTPADFAFIHAFSNDEEVYRHYHWGPNTEADTRRFLDFILESQAKNPREHFELAVSTIEGERIGRAKMRIHSRENREGELAYTLKRTAWGRGCGTELARTLLRFGFRDLGLHRIYATAFAENIASQRVLEKCGMRREGLLRENHFVRGQWRSSLLYAVLSHEFTAS